MNNNTKKKLIKGSEKVISLTLQGITCATIISMPVGIVTGTADYLISKKLEEKYNAIITEEINKSIESFKI